MVETRSDRGSSFPLYDTESAAWLVVSVATNNCAKTIGQQPASHFNQASGTLLHTCMDLCNGMLALLIQVAGCWDIVIAKLCVATINNSPTTDSGSYDGNDDPGSLLVATIVSAMVKLVYTNSNRWIWQRDRQQQSTKHVQKDEVMSASVGYPLMLFFLYMDFLWRKERHHLLICLISDCPIKSIIF